MGTDRERSKTNTLPDNGTQVYLHVISFIWDLFTTGFSLLMAKMLVLSLFKQFVELILFKEYDLELTGWTYDSGWKCRPNFLFTVVCMLVN